MMNEILFLVEQAEEGGFIAKALHESIYVQADNEEELHANIRDAIACHFGITKDELLNRLL
ncbi:hypothetical protein DOJK_01081 [Patescibacteria group bacterium]|nr:hypothetical protein DOJK_01081 [Patescibacteria group bacterium]